VAYSLGRSGTRWRTLCAQVYAQETHCWLCRAWVNQSLPREHPMSRTVDHLRELWEGGDPLDRANCRLAHRRCNTIKSNQRRAAARKGRAGAEAFTVDAKTL
jgi:5-methylcytosine-specific restriction endonuclease McrA